MPFDDLFLENIPYRYGKERQDTSSIIALVIETQLVEMMTQSALEQMQQISESE